MLRGIVSINKSFTAPKVVTEIRKFKEAKLADIKSMLIYMPCEDQEYYKTFTS